MGSWHLLKLESYWSRVAGPSSSWLWEKLVKIRPILEANIHFLIGNGISINLWLDPWSSLGVLVKQYGENVRRGSGMERKAKIADLVSSDSSHLIVLELHKRVSEAYRIDATKQDKVVWRMEASREFSFKSARNSIWKKNQIFRMIDILWFQDHIPRHAFILWKLAYRRLSTEDRLSKFRINVDPNCSFCWNAQETYEHLFFSCQFSNRIWVEVLKSITTENRRGLLWYK